MNDIDTRLANRILWGLVLGAVAGSLTLFAGGFYPDLLAVARRFSVLVLDPLGQVFLRMLFFVVIPLVFASLAQGVAQLERLAQLGPLATRTFTLFFLNMAIAVALGLVMMNTIEPGSAMDPEAKTRLLEEYGGAAQQYIERRAAQPDVTPMTVVEMFMPRNLFGAFVGNNRDLLGDVLPLILFAILVGAAATRLPPDRGAKLRSALGVINDLMTSIVHFALALAPYAVPALIYSVIVKIGWDIVLALGVFVLGCLAVMLLHLFGTMSLWLRLLAKRRPLEFWRLIRPVLVTAFSTSSSAATLPTALAAAREQLGIRPSVAGFVLPLGTTMNMAGTALYEGCVVLFVAQVFGVELGLAQQMALLVLAVLSAVAVAAIPGGSLPLIAGLLATFGIPPEGIGIILGVDRILDMTRTMVNVGSDVVTTAVVDRYTKLGDPPGAAG
ncbi:MAG TPA: dicarboxylate/amino acid:cation symporter [Steroidobacteraceae bacterium]|nr:dicarboxylate/amino acid:cation symporter [Steroidobacteraceae bacterium]